VSVWVEAARPRTLPAAVAPVLVGTAATAPVGFSAWRLVAALVVALAVQVGVNYANDYSDGVRGVDTAARIGPRRAVASGLVRPAEMRVAIAAALAVAAVAGLALAAVAGWWLLLLGAVCFLAALGYSGGARPYASAGLGEVVVFVFFGLVATIGSAYVQVEAVPGAAVAGAVPVGLLATALLVVNNLRDMPTDAPTGKRTLAVRLGAPRTRRLYQALVLAPLPLALVVAVAAGSLWPLLALVAAWPALLTAAAVADGATGRGLVPVLGATGRVQLLYAGGLALGLVLS